MIRLKPATHGQAARRVISCDLQMCTAAISTTGDSAAEARAQAHARGWRHGTAARIDRSLDTCPKCSERWMEAASKAAQETAEEGAEA